VIEDLANSRYLMTAYGASSDGWEAFRQTGQQAPLYEVAAILCGAWTVLSEDNDFFAGLSELSLERMDPDLRSALGGIPPPTPNADRAKLVEDFLDHLDVNRLLARELSVLVQAGMEPAHAVRLVTDLRSLLAGQISPLSDGDMSALRANVSMLAEDLCKAEQALRVFDFDVISESEAGRAPPPRWMDSLRVVG
jgi:hypothetical protein